MKKELSENKWIGYQKSVLLYQNMQKYKKKQTDRMCELTKLAQKRYIAIQILANCKNENNEKKNRIH